MKKGILVAFLLLLTQSIVAQESNQEMLEQAEQKLEQAIEKQDYDQASILKKEIELRKQIEEALAAGDYDQASALKKQLEGTITEAVEVEEEEVDDSNEGNYAFPKPSKGKAIVEFVRVTANGWNAGVRLFDNRQYLGSCWGVSHMRHEFDPGEHLFWVYWDIHEAFLTADLEADKVYVVYLDFNGTGVFIDLGLTPITAGESARIERAKRVIYKHPLKVTSPEDLTKVQAKLEKKGYIDKMFKKYNKKYEGTDKVLRLEPDMNIPWKRMQP